MKTRIISLIASVLLLICFTDTSFAFSSDPNNDDIGIKTIAYFENLFGKLKQVVDQDPTYDTFRAKMKPVAESVEGFYGGTLIDSDFVIRQVYFKSHFLARGFDLKKVKELTDFWDMMKKNPQPQLSEPGHGSIMQPRLIAMRYPVVKDGKLKNIVSMMVRTEYYLKYSGLDDCKAYKIICRGKLAEQKGELGKNYKEVKLQLPSTQWVIQYEK